MNITTKKVLKFTLLPGILPLLRDLFSTGFSQIALLMAQIYGAVRLLPPGHPYLNPANAGRFGLRHVIAAAANNLKFKRENADQIAVFVFLLIGMAMLFLQFVFLGMSFFMHQAHADTMPAVPSFNYMFSTYNRTTDLAFILMDRVFGVPDIFNSCVAQNIPCLTDLNRNNDGSTNAVGEGIFPWPFHRALHSVFGFYSTGLLVVALIIFIYYVAAVAVETAQTGTPFGQRFSRVWAPIRMVVALGLLIPMGGSGLNSAQYIVLYAAKWGSGFATNGWLLFADTALPRSGTSANNSAADHYVARPNPPELTNLLEYNTVLQTCWAANRIIKTQHPLDIKAYFVGDSSDSTPRFEVTADTTYEEALKFYKGQNIRIVFGACQMQNDKTGETQDCSDSTLDEGDGAGDTYSLVYADQPGGVLPICGEIDMKAPSADKGAQAIQSDYFDMIVDLWEAYDSTNQTGEINFDTPTSEWMGDWGTIFVANSLSNVKASTIDAGDVTEVHNAYDEKMQAFVLDGVNAETAANLYDNVETLGWAGAAIWYNKIAQMNGGLVTAANSLPTVVHYPQIMEAVRAAKAQSSVSSSGREVFNPKLANDKTIPDSSLKEEDGARIAQVYYKAYDLWAPQYPQPSGSLMEDFVKNLFGLRGLYDMQNQPDVQPLAQLAMLGRTLVERGIDAIAVGGAGALGGGIASYFHYNASAQVIQQLSGIVMQLSILAISAGFLLFYVVPFLPFLYFFFAIGTWIKGIFEAMVGVPLWALAHIRIEGDNLPGPAAGAGYLMIMEIFLRPILIVFGLLASVIFFSAEVRVLQDIWTLVVTNLTGFNTTAASGAHAPAPGQPGSISEFRGAMDQFFYTLIFAIVVYMLGSASFKLIFLIPNGIMRWLGHGNIRAFNDDSAQVAEGIMGKMQYGVERINALSSQTVSRIGDISGAMQKNNVAKQNAEGQQSALNKARAEGQQSAAEKFRKDAKAKEDAAAEAAKQKAKNK